MVLRVPPVSLPEELALGVLKLLLLVLPLLPPLAHVRRHETQKSPTRTNRDFGYNFLLVRCVLKSYAARYEFAQGAAIE